MAHVIYVEGGEVRQCSKVTSVPKGVEYWLAKEGEVPETKDDRDAWVWNPTRPADGRGTGA